MLLLYHQNLEKKTVKSIQNIFIRSIGFFHTPRQLPLQSVSGKKRKMQEQECILYE